LYEGGNPVFKLEGRPRALRLHEILKVAGVEKAPKLKIKGKQGAEGQLKRNPLRLQRRPVVAPPPPAQDVPAAVPEVAPGPPARPRMRAKTKDPMDPTFEESGLRKNVSTPTVHKLTDQNLL